MSTEQDTQTVKETPVQPITNVEIGYDEGHYDMLSDDKSACVRMIVTIGEERVAISETWPIDDTPGRDDMREPEEAITLIEERLKAYWLNTSRDKKLRNIELFRSRIDEINYVWAQGRLAAYEEQIGELQRLIEYLNKYHIADYEPATSEVSA